MSSNTRRPAFLGLTPPLSDPDRARFHVLPVPFECTVSYGRGTAAGPDAILAASTQIEWFDGTGVPCEAGIHTLPHLPVTGVSPEHATDLIREAVAAILAAGHTPVMLGGEHTVTYGAVQAARAVAPDLGVVQFDAHADLRDTYEGTPYSHASVMRRVIDMGIPLFQIGVRSHSAEECPVRRPPKVRALDAATIARQGIPDPLLPADFPTTIYLTFDVDALDPSVVPGTGTPEPGGLAWYQALDLLETVIRGRRIVGFDAVELAPIRVPGLHASEFAVARLVYMIMGLIVRQAA